MWEYIKQVAAVAGIITFLLRVIPIFNRWILKLLKNLNPKTINKILIIFCIVLVSIAIILQILLICGILGPCNDEIVITAKELPDKFTLQEAELISEFDKVVLYGTMIGSFEVCLDSSMLIVQIQIPNNGWGEGLSGPDGSSLQITVGNETKEIKIDSSMDYHHGRYYKYGASESFINTFQLKKQNKITLEISMVGGACLDIENIKLSFK